MGILAKNNLYFGNNPGEESSKGVEVPYILDIIGGKKNLFRDILTVLGKVLELTCVRDLSDENY